MNEHVFDRTQRKEVPMPEKLKCFFEEIEAVCRKYGYSIAHEDEFGRFEIQNYKKENVDWLFDAALFLEKE